jgi:MoxR-like ATPase
VTQASLEERNERIRAESAFLSALTDAVDSVIVGQREMIRRVLIGLLSDGHLLLEGVPGLAKTLLIKTVAQAIHAKFHRIQFTPDLLPADLTGTLVFDPKAGTFKPRLGPVFTHILLADEINRAPAKVQSALLEAMQERQVTIGDTTYPLESLFWVLATQNPIEQEGTYPLPEAQMDRFLLKVRVAYPSPEEEARILDRMGGEPPEPPRPVVGVEAILAARHAVNTIYLDPPLHRGSGPRHAGAGAVRPRHPSAGPVRRLAPGDPGAGARLPRAGVPRGSGLRRARRREGARARRVPPPHPAHVRGRGRGGPGGRDHAPDPLPGRGAVTVRGARAA